MERFQLVSAGRVTLAVGKPCSRNRITLVVGTPFVHVNSLSRPPGITFHSQAFKQITACFRGHNLVLGAILVGVETVPGHFFS